MLLLSPGFAQGREAGQWWAGVLRGDTPAPSTVQSPEWAAAVATLQRLAHEKQQKAQARA